ncbi:peptidoglycan-binding protein [Flavonifractor plautii]|jgi:peptidoglycan hydrolase-like protein with peptidoglycan-binding domain|uniref:peptidoglycan-binding protein n=1 Tax=Flavonifractor plautii TaxID=292800 RepID=UPI003DA45C37
MASIPSWPNLAKGNTGTNIKALQCLLNYRNNNTALAVDGSFGPSVYNAVVAFQKSKGITANGIAGKDTLSRLVAVVQNGNRNEAVRGAQHLLSKFESLTIDGSFGPSCLTAVKNFQKKMEISVDGSVGPTTWQYLFGYDKYPGGGSTGGTSHIIKMPSGRRCCWNQRYLEIVNTIGSKSGCTITTALDLVNFYGPSNYSIANIKGAWISGQGMNWNYDFSKCGSKLGVASSKTDVKGTAAFPVIRAEIDAEHPVIVNIGTGNSSNHTVMCYGYKNGGKTYDDFLVMDPIKFVPDSPNGKLQTTIDGSDHTLQMAMDNNKHPQGIWCIRKTYRKN